MQKILAGTGRMSAAAVLQRPSVRTAGGETQVKGASDAKKRPGQRPGRLQSNMPGLRLFRLRVFIAVIGHNDAAVGLDTGGVGRDVGVFL